MRRPSDRPTAADWLAGLATAVVLGLLAYFVF